MAMPLSIIVTVLFAIFATPTRAGDLLPLFDVTGEVENFAIADLASRRELQRVDLLVWDSHSRELPAEATSPETIEAVREWIEKGGRLLLFSHAVQWLHELGIEPVTPDRRDTRLLGHSDGYSKGLYVYGLAASDPEHPLFAGLESYGERQDVFLLAGGHAVRAESCFWERSIPKRARVLGTFFRHGYGEDRSFSHRVLVSCEVGEGRVLALGCGPLFTVGNPHRENLERFIANAVRWLYGEETRALPRIGVLPTLPARLGIDEYSSKPPEPEPAPWPEELVGPRLPYIAHWGWHGQIDYQRGGQQSIDLDYFRTRIVDESAAWGANLLEFYPPDMKLGFPFAWEKDDPIARPERYWGGGFDPLWDLPTARELIRHAHSRGFLVHSFNHPNPVRGPFEDFVAYTERTARDLANPLLHGPEAALDGFGTEWFPSDREGLITETLWKYNPGAYQHSTAVLPAYTPNFSGTLMCAFGRLGSLNACGFSDQWRDVYHPPLYLSYQADCRTRKPSRRDWGGWARYGGGSYPDWILRQVNGFCRERLELDSAIWWLGEPESTLHSRYREYVYGISMDPIRCAVACKLWATGRGGYRQTIAELSPDPPPGFAAGSDQPFDSAILQNNFLRLVRHGDREGGMLLYDPSHLARFDPDVNGDPRAVVLFDDFLSSKSEAPSIELDDLVLRLGTRDGLAEGGASGGYEVDIVAAEESFPARIAYEATPDWPERMHLRFESRAGRHRVSIGILEGDEPGLVEVLLDGEPIGFYTTGARSAPPRPHGGPREFEFSIVEPDREHELVLQVQSGAGHAFDYLELRRIAADAVLHTVEVAAGVCAELSERVAGAESSASLGRHRRYSILSDSPVLSIHLTSAVGESKLLATLDLSSWRETSSGWIRREARIDRWLGLVRAVEGDAPRYSLGIFPSREKAESFEIKREAEIRTPSASGYPLFFVHERDAEGRASWTTRGAQAVAGKSVIRVHDTPEAKAIVRDADFLESGFRPGWGCQHVLAFEDSERRGTCRVRVVKTGPFLFAPRVEYQEPVRSVQLDGEDWRYFEGNTIFLPNRCGPYELHIETKGPVHPSLSRTYLTVTECRWDESSESLRITTEVPEWYTGPLPGDLDYCVMLRGGGWKLIDSTGSEAIALDSYPLRTDGDRRTTAANGLILRLSSGTAILRFER
jgi:hypothetical protein